MISTEHLPIGSQNRTAIVTGGGTGIGRAISILLAKQGMAVAIVYSRSDNDARETVSTITKNGGQAMALQADIASVASVREMTETVANSFGGIDYLVNNAGITHQMQFNDLNAINDDIWDALLAVNVKGTFHCCQAAAPYLQQRPNSAIINIGSIAGETGYGSSLPYAVSKSAVHGMTRSLAKALAPRVRVNGIAPGAVATRWWKDNEEKMHALSGHLPLQRISTPEDIAALVLMLLTAESVTGQILRADNGQTL
ncbi:SDR family NAD(P)-dependent oxidoreductase [Advenella mimigardefordensis]|uniref:Putative oxidoreductase, SDR family n=1 Tax=Advenella mimigardefordensis (strain DSM 17166 / LMG 22922 / DPN7) TaxID=1247726 RepID=W0PK85_ADVMD|nr:SDR family oxidoreductase [Advenella mimigardefordensis]AHG65403.1 putative oxidoreductase, SDR family [Advenella mimigardefordensis DPN7]